MRLLSNALLCGVLLTCLPIAIARAETRDTIDLDGVWNFATDPDNRGEAEKWFEPSAKLPAMP
ncbi:MAG: hypothetical protein WC655_27185, partial [Candidatus Hydrogenedentales bacterium]